MSHLPPSAEDALPPFSLSFLSPSILDRICRSTPFQFHAPFPSSPSFIEPYIPIPSSRTQNLDLIVTPPRTSDLTAQTTCLNDPSVGIQLIGPPYPYTDQMGREWYEMKWRHTESYFRSLSSEEGDGRRELPFSTIREKETGEWFGEIGVCRWEFREIADEKERERLRKENDERAIGDEELIWSFGYYVSPKFQGKGIMTHVLSSLFESVFIDYLDAKIIRSSAFVDNEASIRVQEKCGLGKKDGSNFRHRVDEGRGGGEREEIVLEWRRD
ncbi:GNAT family N-acetyltransferase [Sporobolomyces salmoneus]|uniref:GNAT family N-acetyltransferase n=1 Tax=Sporobolomyces salmoneus TaxID=183962 RepID=UPI003173B957